MVQLIKKDGSLFTPTDEQIISWQRAYPRVDVYCELDAMACWCDANPQKRKVQVERFIVNWLSRANQRGGSPMSKSGAKSTRTMTTEEMMDRSWAL